MEERRSERKRAAPNGTARGTTLVITNLMKLAGIAVFLHEAFTTKDYVVMATAGFAMAGAQVSENVILGILDRVLGSAQGKK